MALIASISGIRGTIGGESESNLTPLDVVKFTSAFGMWMHTKSDSMKVVVGRDARVSGPMIEQLVCATLVGMGYEVFNLGLSTTPTVEMAVPHFNAAGGIVITASHNGIEWNALKLLNRKGEFVSQKGAKEILDIQKNEYFSFSPVHELGKITPVEDFTKTHIERIIAHPYTDTFSIGKANFKVLVDGINSSGGVFVPVLLNALGVTDIVELNCIPDGKFAHKPEPLKENLLATCEAVLKNKCDFGIVVDPDVDRLVFIDEKGELFGEEYTLVAVADYVLKNKQGPVVSNLSSSRALRDLAVSYGCAYYASAVGEVNVIEIMKRHDAVIGGEGNGGVILPDLHFGRDALAGIALFLSHLAKAKITCSALRKHYPDYFMSKQKVELKSNTNTTALLDKLKELHNGDNVNTSDGVKIDFEEGWVHLRVSNTEPIIRIYSEAKSQEEADKLAKEYVETLNKLS